MNRVLEWLGTAILIVLVPVGAASAIMLAFLWMFVAFVIGLIVSILNGLSNIIYAIVFGIRGAKAMTLR